MDCPRSASDNRSRAAATSRVVNAARGSDDPARAKLRLTSAPKGPAVIFDHRTYKCRPGTLALYVKLYEEFALPLQRKYLGEPFAYLIAETGELNTCVHIWAFRDAADRATRRAAMQADPDWPLYLKKSGEAGYLVEQTNKIMVPAPFMKLPQH
jgi:hypothetical protein